MSKYVLKVNYKQYIAKESFQFYIISSLTKKIIFQQFILSYLICTYFYLTN